jgi:hypothetical protein
MIFEEVASLKQMSNCCIYWEKREKKIYISFLFQLKIEQKNNRIEYRDIVHFFFRESMSKFISHRWQSLLTFDRRKKKQYEDFVPAMMFVLPFSDFHCCFIFALATSCDLF